MKTMGSTDEKNTSDAAIQRSPLAPLRAYIEKADLSNDRSFASMIKRALTELRMVPGEMCGPLRIPRPVAMRWLSEATVPAFNLREPVRKFFLKKIDEREATA